MTARDIQDKAKKFGWPWTFAKGFDTALPISEFIPEQVHILLCDPWHLILKWMLLFCQSQQQVLPHDAAGYSLEGSEKKTEKVKILCLTIPITFVKFKSGKEINIAKYKYFDRRTKCFSVMFT